MKKLDKLIRKAGIDSCILACNCLLSIYLVLKEQETFSTEEIGNGESHIGELAINMAELIGIDYATHFFGKVPHFIFIPISETDAKSLQNLAKYLQTKKR